MNTHEKETKILLIVERAAWCFLRRTGGFSRSLEVLRGKFYSTYKYLEFLWSWKACFNQSQSHKKRKKYSKCIYFRLIQKRYDNWSTIIKNDKITNVLNKIFQAKDPTPIPPSSNFHQLRHTEPDNDILGLFRVLASSFFVLNSVETFPIYGDSLWGLLTPITPLISNKIGNLGTYILRVPAGVVPLNKDTMIYFYEF